MQTPENGFYAHYKHQADGEPFNYIYEVVGIERHTEDDSLLVIYRPLYENDWLSPATLCARPVEMFMDEVNVGGNKMPRFRKLSVDEEHEIFQ